MMTTTDRPARLRCPKCAGDLMTFERQGIHVEQCTDCRGIWLDRGELDRLIDIEARFEADARRDERRGDLVREPRHDARYDDRRDPEVRSSRSSDGWDDDDDRGGWYGDSDDRRRAQARPSRKRSLFGELFEGFME